METLLRIGLSNALMATMFAVLVAAFSRICRRPAVVHSLWLLVLLKLITPPIWNIPIHWPADWEATTSHAKPIAPEVEPVASLDSPGPARGAGDVAKIDEDAIPADEATPLLPVNMSTTISHPQRAGEPIGMAETPSAEIAAAADMSAPAPAPAFPPLPWMSVLVMIWLAGSVAWFALTSLRLFRFQGNLHCAQPAPQKVREQVQRLAEQFGLAHCPTIWLVPGRMSPLLYALGRSARLFVPAALWQRLTEDQQLTLLAHELAHLRRRDQWVRGLELVVTGLYWWHPVVWWACREIREAEEQCCDAWVVWALPKTARAYATALLETVDFLSETQTALPVAASGIGHVHDLRRRLTMIMRGTTPRALSSAAFLAVLGLGALLLPLVPSWAQQSPSEREEQERRVRPAAGQEQERVDEEGAAERYEATREQVAQMEAQVKQAQAQLEQSMAQLRDAKARLDKMHEDWKAARNRPDTGGSTRSPMRGISSKSDPGSPANLDQRLTQVEKKLDTLLSEVRSLRREMRRSQPDARFAPGMPGMMPGGMRGGGAGMMGGPGGPMMPPGAPGAKGPGGGIRAPGAGQGGAGIHGPGQPGTGGGIQPPGPLPPPPVPEPAPGSGPEAGSEPPATPLPASGGSAAGPAPGPQVPAPNTPPAVPPPARATDDRPPPEDKPRRP